MFPNVRSQDRLARSSLMILSWNACVIAGLKAPDDAGGCWLVMGTAIMKGVQGFCHFCEGFNAALETLGKERGETRCWGKWTHRPTCDEPSLLPSPLLL
jgi:hypothetical protein